MWSMSYHLNVSELNFNVQNVCRSISKFTVLLQSFWWYSVSHFEVRHTGAKFVVVFRSFSLTVLSGILRLRMICHFLVLQFLGLTFFRNQIKRICATLLFAWILQIMQRDQLKNRKFYENLSEYANFQSPLAKASRPKAKF